MHGVVVRGWAREICGIDDGIRLDRSRIEVHEFDVGLARDKLFIGAQAGRQSPDEGFGGGVERDTWNRQFCRERAVEGDKDWVGEGGFAEGGKEGAGEKGREERVPPDDREMYIFRPFFESDGFTCLSTSIENDHEGILRLTFWLRCKSRQRC